MEESGVRKADLLGTLFITLLLIAAPTAFAQVNHGDFLGTGVDFLDVTETTATAGDPAVLWDAPTVGGTGGQLQFFPPNFTSTCVLGSSDITTSVLTSTLVAAPGNTLNEIALVESGDVTLVKFPPFGDATTNATAAMSGSITVTKDSGGPIVPVEIPFVGTFTPTGTFSLPGDFGTSIWSGSMLVDIAAAVPNATEAVLSLDNTLTTNCGAGATSGLIQKKVVSGPSVSLIVNPVECDLSIEKTCCVPAPASPGLDLCDGKTTRAVFEVVGGDCADTTNYQDGEVKCTGTNPVLDPENDTVDIAIIKDADKISVNGTLGGATGVPVGSTIEFVHSGGDLKGNTKFEISGPGGTQLLHIHTSCSRSLACGDQFGSVQLVELETTLGGTVICDPVVPDGTTQCTPPQGEVGLECTAKPAEIIFQYTGVDCQDPLPQEGAKCSGDPAGAEPVSVIYTGTKPDRYTLSPSSNIKVGETFAFTATRASGVPAQSKFLIQDVNGVVQNVEIHTSCSQPLACGAEFGSLKIVEYTQKDGLNVS